MKTSQEIIKNNKLIAEFMGGKMIVENHYGINIIKLPNNKDFDLFGLKYHNSWDWLIPVVNLIKERQIFGSQHLIDKIDNVLICDCELIHLHNAVIDFIKWYNNQ